MLVHGLVPYIRMICAGDEEKIRNASRFEMVIGELDHDERPPTDGLQLFRP